MTPAAALVERAKAELAIGGQLGMASDVLTYADKGLVLLAVARPGASCVIRIPAAEFCGITVLELAGMLPVDPPTPPDPEQLRKEHHARRR